jgi:hypothetical protein
MGVGKVKGKYRLQSVKCYENGSVETNYSSEDKKFLKNYKMICPDDLIRSIPPFPNFHPLEILFITPTLLKFHGRLRPSLEFHVLIRNLLGRISLLSYFHCDQ